MLSVATLLISLSAIYAADLDYVKTPHGYRLRKCVHQAPNGAILTPYDGYTEMYHPETNVRRHYPRDEDCIDDMNQLFAPNDGHRLETWVDYAYYSLSNVDAMGNFTSVYQLPSESPEAKGQLLYYFIGLQDNSNVIVSIIQPVVNYCGNSDDCDSFNFTQGWSMEPWNCCLNGETWYGQNIPVALSDSVNAYIIAGRVETQIDIGMNDVTTDGPHTVLTVNDTNRVWDWAAATLEEYDAVECPYYNSSPFNCTEMSLIDLAGSKITPSWETEGYTACKGGVVVNDPASVSIYGTDKP